MDHSRKKVKVEDIKDTDTDNNKINTDPASEDNKMKVVKITSEPDDGVTNGNNTQIKTEPRTEHTQEESTEANTGTGTPSNNNINEQTVFEYIHSTAFREKVDQIMISHRIPGLSIGFADSQRQTFVSFGQADIATVKPFDEHTVVAIHQCSQIFTAAALARLFERNPLRGHWSRPLASILDGVFVMSKPEHTAQVTADDIVSHTTGLQATNYVPGMLETVNPLNMTKLLRRLPVYDKLPGISQLYHPSNIMYSVGAHLVAHLSGKSFARYLSRKLWLPAGMQSTFIDSEAVTKAGADDRRTTMYTLDPQTRQHVALPRMELPDAIGGYSVHSTTFDLLQWSNALRQRTGPITQRMYHDLTRVRRFLASGDRTDHAPFSPVFCTGICAGMTCLWRVVPLSYTCRSIPQGGPCLLTFSPEDDLDLSIAVCSNMQSVCHGIESAICNDIIAFVLRSMDRQRDSQR